MGKKSKRARRPETRGRESKAKKRMKAKVAENAESIGKKRSRSKKEAQKVSSLQKSEGITEAVRDGLAWLQDKEKVAAHMKKFDLIDLLQKSDGLIRIENFLPPQAAEAALHILKTLPASRWEVRKNVDNAEANTTQHKFFIASPSGKNSGDPLWLLTSLVHSFLPEKRSVFSAAKYESGNHITEHDDHAYVHHKEESDKAPVFCSRDIAVILYLTKDWTEQDGGVLVDLATSKRYVPKFNSVVSFVVPRFHEVTAVQARVGRDPRFSVFGWFLAEGDLYNYVEDTSEVNHSAKNVNSFNSNRKKKRKPKRHHSF